MVQPIDDISLLWTWRWFNIGIFRFDLFRAINYHLINSLVKIWLDTSVELWILYASIKRHLVRLTDSQVTNIHTYNIFQFIHLYIIAGTCKITLYLYISTIKAHIMYPIRRTFINTSMLHSFTCLMVQLRLRGLNIMLDMRQTENNISNDSYWITYIYMCTRISNCRSKQTRFQRKLLFTSLAKTCTL